jgi:hypothetical protein
MLIPLLLEDVPLAVSAWQHYLQIFIKYIVGWTAILQDI